jgi:flavodoxin
MVKAIVLYNSRGGNTKKIAMKIAEGLGAECRSNWKIPNLKDYNLVVVGSWMIMGRISFTGARYLRRLRRKGINGKKVALFFTSGDPENIHPFTQNTENPRTIKEIMFTSMEKILEKNKDIKILEDRFYSVGSARMIRWSKDGDPPGRPNDEELVSAKAFGEKLKKS